MILDGQFPKNQYGLDNAQCHPLLGHTFCLSYRVAGPAPRAAENRETSAPALVSFSPSTSLSLPPHSYDHQLIGVAKKNKKIKKEVVDFRFKPMQQL